MTDSVSFRRRNKEKGHPESSGYTSMEEESLQHSGVRGVRSWCLSALIVFLLLVAVANALITAGLVYVLSVTHLGMESVELLSGGDYIRLLTNLEVENLILGQDIFARNLAELEISGHEVSISVQDGSQVIVNKDHIRLSSSDLDLTLAPGMSLFSTNAEVSLDTYQVKNLHAPYVEVGSVSSSRLFPDLFIESFHDADVVGMEGVQVETEGSLDIKSPQNDIVIHSLHGAMKLLQEEGLYLDMGLPVEGKGSSSSERQYKLCVCGTSGKVFAVPEQELGLGCQLAHEINPCED